MDTAVTEVTEAMEATEAVTMAVSEVYTDHTVTLEEVTSRDHTVVLLLADLSEDTVHMAVSVMAVESTPDTHDMVTYIL